MWFSSFHGIIIITLPPNAESKPPLQYKPHTAQTDVWSLGCVLYEMVATKPPFEGQNLRNLITKVITNKPYG